MDNTLFSHLNISNAIASIAGLGTASFALVDASKSLGGGPSNHGFGQIKKIIFRLYGTTNFHPHSLDPFDCGSILRTLRANWLNGMSLSDQKAVAKSLIKLGLDEINKKNPNHLAKVTGVDPSIFESVISKISSGSKLDDNESNVLGRFDLMLSAVLDEGYQRADQMYRNWAKFWSVIVSVLIAIGGGWIVGKGNYSLHDILTASIIGLLATPLAPVSKDLSSALVASVRSMQLLRK